MIAGNKARHDWICPFGYWVGPDGEIVGLSSWQAHMEDAPSVACEHGIAFGDEHEDNFSASTALMDAGWATMTLNQYLLNPTICMAYPTDKQARALAKILRAHVKSTRDDFITIGSLDFSTLAGAVQCILQRRDDGINGPPEIIEPTRGSAGKP